MKMTEAQLRKVIREELLKEMNSSSSEEQEAEEEKGKLYPGTIAGGLAAGISGGYGVNWLLDYIQTHPELTEPLINFLKAMGTTVQE
jgi:hypothetical protein